MNFYSILGLAPSASVTEVKRAYRRLARRHHPGINPGDRAVEALFRRISEAYETLADPELRQRYDTAVPQAPDEDRRAFEFTGFDFTVAAQGLESATFTELFAEVLHPVASADRGRTEAGADVHASLSVSFDDALRGVERQIMVTRHVSCVSCQGAGEMRVAEVPCSRCDGSGAVRWARGYMLFTKACAPCAGTGREKSRTCGVCGGPGRSVRSEGIRLRIPAGVRDGARLRVPGRGHAGRCGGRNGDLYVDVSVRPHRVMRRDGDDLHMVVPVAVHEAALGARIEVPSSDGPLHVKVPAGAQAGHRFKVSGRGAVSPSGARGDLYVEIRLALPAVVDARSKELMREFARLNPEDVRRDFLESFASEG
ncbi:MAG TPA: J domain-containing protein [Vicinamibacterales bacterium]|nr:J domain-containing protein [Vicinamibacterales bacterium]